MQNCEKKRLNKFLSDYGSRRKADDWIAEGRVCVNGERATLGCVIDPSIDKVTLDGKPIEPKKVKLITYLLHKPVGTICSAKKISSNDKLVIDLFKTEERLFTIGRLDKNTSGLLLVSNDGDLAQKIIHPSSHIEKEYLVYASSPVSDLQFRQLLRGVEIDGVHVAPTKVVKESRRAFFITLMEGKNREIRRMCEAADIYIQELIRIRIGGLYLPSDMREGSYRVFTPNDSKLLFGKDL